MSRIGGKLELENESSLGWCMESSYGIMFGYGQGNSHNIDTPREAINFMVEQFQRFNIPLHDLIIPIFEETFRQVISYIDTYDPYSVVLDYSDIRMSSNWLMKTHDVREYISGVDQERFVTAEPEFLETFEFVPGQSEKQFVKWLQHPGLENIEWGGEQMGEHLSFYYFEDGGRFDNLSKTQSEFVDRFCTNPKTGASNMKAYLELAAWAAWVWFCGPPGKDYRYKHHELFRTCIDHGEGIVYHGEIYRRNEYKVYDNPPRSCSKCGLDSYCAELVQIGGQSVYLCNKCIHGDRAMAEGASCGTRFCKFVECHYHVYHGQGKQGLYHMLRSSENSGLHQLAAKRGMNNGMVGHRSRPQLELFG